MYFLIHVTVSWYPILLIFLKPKNCPIHWQTLYKKHECDILLFLRHPCTWIIHGKNGHLISDSNLGSVKIIQKQWQWNRSKTILIRCMAHWNRYIPTENFTFQFLRKNTDITFFFGRINCDAMESVLLSLEHFVPSSFTHCRHWLD